MGGARPKTVVQDSDVLWLAKFNSTDNRRNWNNTRVEHAMLRLAREKRQRKAMRAHMVSGLTILRADEAPEARPNAKNILSQHARFLLDKGEGEKIMNDMKAQVEA
jgi:serine/threonine-protein kinase HipA